MSTSDANMQNPRSNKPKYSCLLAVFFDMKIKREDLSMTAIKSCFTVLHIQAL